MKYFTERFVSDIVKRWSSGSCTYLEYLWRSVNPLAVTEYMYYDEDSRRQGRSYGHSFFFFYAGGGGRITTSLQTIRCMLIMLCLHKSALG